MLRYYRLGPRADPEPSTWTPAVLPGFVPAARSRPGDPEPVRAEPAGAEPLGAERTGAEPAGAAPVRGIETQHADRVAGDALPAVASDGGRFA